METIKILDAMKRCVDRDISPCWDCPYTNCNNCCSTLKKDMNADPNIPRHLIEWFNSIEDATDPDTLYTEDEANRFYNACDNLIEELTPKAVDHDWDTDLSLTEEEEEDELVEECDVRQGMVDRIQELEKTIEIYEGAWNDTYESYLKDKEDLEKELKQCTEDLEKELKQRAEDIEKVRQLHSGMVAEIQEELDDAKTELVAYDERHMNDIEKDEEPGLVEFIKGFSEYLEKNPSGLSKKDIEEVKNIKTTEDVFKWLFS